ncbi:MAG: hypothetical protein ACP5O1_01240 [Phycisphaerae bacterium]
MTEPPNNRSIGQRGQQTIEVLAGIVGAPKQELPTLSSSIGYREIAWRMLLFTACTLVGPATLLNWALPAGFHFPVGVLRIVGLAAMAFAISGIHAHEKGWHRGLDEQYVRLNARWKRWTLGVLLIGMYIAAAASTIRGFPPAIGYSGLLFQLAVGPAGSLVVLAPIFMLVFACLSGAMPFNGYMAAGLILTSAILLPAMAFVAGLASPVLRNEMLDLALRVQTTAGSVLVFLAVGLAAVPAGTFGNRYRFPGSFTTPWLRTCRPVRLLVEATGRRAAAIYAVVAVVAAVPGLVAANVISRGSPAVGGNGSFQNLFKTAFATNFSPGALSPYSLAAMNAALAITAICLARIRAENWRLIPSGGG